MGAPIPTAIAIPWRHAFAALAVFVLFALLHPIDHDESQYVAATVLSAHGLLPYRDYAYLQTPLQPLLFAPVAWIAGAVVWPALRLVNAVLGVWILGCVWRAARQAGAGERPSLLAAGLLGASDILLFSITTARNDALPAALLATALVPIVRAQQGRGSAATAVLIGLVLAAAAAAKISYVLPALAYGIWALCDRRLRPFSVLLGALPVLGLVAWCWALMPEAFVFGALRFPALAPAEFYTARPWKLSLAAKAIDTLKFLALGPPVLALIVVAWRARRPGVLEALALAGLAAALLPEPTWRQYLMPALPPLFVLLALAWERTPPARGVRILAVVTLCGGLAPTAIGAASGPGAMMTALREGAMIRAALDAAAVTGAVATLSPQFVAGSGRLPDPRFATGPFYFRSHRLLDADAEARMQLVSRDRLEALDRTPPAAVLIGGEGPWTSGDAALDARLERWALSRSYRRTPVPSTHFKLYARAR